MVSEKIYNTKEKVMSEEVTKTEPTFDNVAYAQAVKEREEIYLSKAKLALIMSGVASVLGALMLIESFMADFMPLMFMEIITIVCPIVALISYVIAGGILAALKTWLTLVKWGWFIIFFPINVITVVVAAFFGFLGILYLPFLFVFYNYSKHKSDFDAAVEYLRHCK